MARKKNENPVTEEAVVEEAVAAENPAPVETQEKTKATPLETMYYKDLKKAVSAEMAEKAAKGEAVFQLPAEEKEKYLTPVCPMGLKGYVYQNENAMILMQAMKDLGTKENRFLPDYVVFDKTTKIAAEKGCKVVKITSYNPKSNELGTMRVINFSQLSGEDLAKYDRKFSKGQLGIGSNMLLHNSFFQRDAENKPTEALENIEEKFFELSAKACYNANNRLKERIDFAKGQAENRKAEYEMAREAFKEDVEKRIKVIEEYDISKPYSGNSADGKFLYEMAKAHAEKPEYQGYVFDAAKALLLEGRSETTVKKCIDTYAPKAAEDSIRSEGHAYSDYILNNIKKDKNFQRDMEFKKKSMARTR